jgi:cytochrome P450
MMDAPASELDPFTDEALLNPYGIYRTLRDSGAVVRLARWNLWALMRFKEVRDALGDWRTYSSRAVALNKAFNDFAVDGIETNILMIEPPQHDTLRRILGEDLGPGGLRARVEKLVGERADVLVDQLVRRRSFDAVRDLAQPFVIGLVCDLNGLPEQGRERFLGWADAMFNVLGVANERNQRAFHLLQAMFQFLHQEAGPGKVRPGSWAATIYEAAARGEIPMQSAPALVSTYVAPALDTSINTLGFALKLFAEHPDQWDLLRASPELLPSALREVLRLESPVQHFGRLLTRDVELDGIHVPAGAHIMVSYGSANRDERQWPEPERFDISRDNTRQLAWGHGVHACIGQGLARAEGYAVLGALLRRVRRFEVGAAVPHLNNLIRGLDSLPVTVF